MKPVDAHDSAESGRSLGAPTEAAVQPNRSRDAQAPLPFQSRRTRPVRPLQTTRAPVFGLALMLVAAVAVLVAGNRLARREFDARLPADRAALQELGAALQSELARLEELYVRDLTETAVAVRRDDLFATQAVCAKISGIRKCLLIPLVPSRVQETVNVPGASGGRTPDVIAFSAGQPPSPAGSFALDLTAMAAASNRAVSGWLKSPDPAFGAFWLRRDDGDVIVLVVDWREVAPCVNEHLAAWIEAPIAPLRGSRGLVSVEGPAGALLAGLNPAPPRPADFILPLRNRLGLWQILAWDRIEPRTIYDLRTLVVASTVAGVLAVLGVVLFRQQRRALRRAEERVSFVNRVSHELCTPLTNALLNLDLATDAVEARPDYARQRLRLVNEEIQRLGRLVANVLTFSRRERGTLALKPAPCAPDDVIATVLRQFEPGLARRGIQIERNAAAHETVTLDPDALAQIVGNLVSNVEKYAANGKWLGLETRLDDGALVVRVADRGPGVPAADRDRVFEPFERVGGRVNEGVAGTGLGLTIARELAQRMGGTLLLLPAAAGATFELRVPASRDIIAPAT